MAKPMSKPMHRQGGQTPAATPSAAYSNSRIQMSFLITLPSTRQVELTQDYPRIGRKCELRCHCWLPPSSIAFVCISRALGSFASADVRKRTKLCFESNESFMQVPVQQVNRSLVWLRQKRMLKLQSGLSNPSISSQIDPIVHTEFSDHKL